MKPLRPLYFEKSTVILNGPQPLNEGLVPGIGVILPMAHLALHIIIGRCNCCIIKLNCQCNGVVGFFVIVVVGFVVFVVNFVVNFVVAFFVVFGFDVVFLVVLVVVVGKVVVVVVGIVAVVGIKVVKIEVVVVGIVVVGIVEVIVEVQLSPL